MSENPGKPAEFAADQLVIGIDVGGTFTDLMMFDPTTRRMSAVKVPSTPPAFWPSVIDALDQADVHGGREALVLHGTTVHLNAFLERKGARVALLTTRGFRDVYKMRRGNRPQPYDLHFQYPDPLVAQRDIFEVTERIDAAGNILIAPQAAELDALSAQIAAAGYESVVICFLHSYRNPANEAAVAEHLRARLDIDVIGTSHEVCREMREYERTSTTVVNGYTSPILKRYLADLQAAMAAKSATRLLLLQSNGGLMAVEDAGTRGVLSLLSGPVGGNVASQALSEIAGYPNLICIDMGGTSFEASLVIDGKAVVRTEREVGGFPILASMVDIHTIGAGGGSIAYSDHGALRVGPRSAGARPGPACYGNGGEEPTVTDANMVVGRLEDGARFGALTLDAKLAKGAVARLAGDLGLGVATMAQGILDVINEQMANAIRTITVRRGIDPRDFALIAYGGAGPMHAADIAALLGVTTVIVPRGAGAFSAWGMLGSDLVLDHAETDSRPVAALDLADIDRKFAAQEEILGARLAAQGLPHSRLRFERSLDIRYAGQENALTIALPDGDGREAEIAASFNAAYLDAFGHNNPDEALELSALRLKAIGAIGLTAAELMTATLDPGSNAATEQRRRPVIFDGAAQDTLFLDRTAVPPEGLDGPCVVSEDTCTTIIPPSFRCLLDPAGNLLLRRNQG